jgi:prepilin-type N-terminal cleavage/methylation domain-containing protein
MLKTLKKNKGFTLVEVIVVAVIVAVLALVAIQLYRGYVSESRRNTAENLGAAAAGYLQAVLNARDRDYIDNNLADALAEGDSWTADIAPADDVTNNVIFTCPANATIAKDGNAVTATVGQEESSTYQWDAN